VPSRLLVYPDEGHWILKPQNHRLWMNEVQAWLARWLGTVKVAS
jgi:dipeptidyl aminopeptidase/acylaminoacyl peptidase